VTRAGGWPASLYFEPSGVSGKIERGIIKLDIPALKVDTVFQKFRMFL
jgi:hypothetical protein